MLRCRVWLVGVLGYLAFASASSSAAGEVSPPMVGALGLELEGKPLGSSEVSAGQKLVFQLSVPLMALLFGFLLYPCLSFAGLGITPAVLLIYFGAQSTMNLYMKSVLSDAVVSETLHLKGMPAPFLITGVQQWVTLSLFSLLIIASTPTPWPYRAKRLSKRWDLVVVFSFSLCFVLNISLNNFAISLIPLSVNLVVRTCLPITTYLSQVALGRCIPRTGQATSYAEVFFMVAGVACAILVVIVQRPKDSLDSQFFMIGISACIGSIFCGSLNFALAAVLGTNMKMNPLDTSGYMSIPASVMIIVPILFIAHPVDENQWPPESFASHATDWDILQQVLTLNPGVVGLLVLSGPLAFAYNMLTWRLIHTLSATSTAFAGNFNKAASITIALIFGIDHLPAGWWGVLNVVALVGNISAFTAYSVVRERNKQMAWDADDGSQESSEMGHFAEEVIDGFSPEPSASYWGTEDLAEVTSFADIADCRSLTVSFEVSPAGSGTNTPVRPGTTGHRTPSFTVRGPPGRQWSHGGRLQRPRAPPISGRRA